MCSRSSNRLVWTGKTLFGSCRTRLARSGHVRISALSVLKRCVIATLLEEVSGKHFACELQEWHLEVLKFLKSQVDLVLDNAGRYPPDLLVFASLLLTISPHAYTLLRRSMKLNMPHPDTIRRLCSSCDASPVTEQQESSFLSYAKRIVSTFKEHEKT